MKIEETKKIIEMALEILDKKHAYKIESQLSVMVWKTDEYALIKLS